MDIFIGVLLDRTRAGSYLKLLRVENATQSASLWENFQQFLAIHDEFWRSAMFYNAFLVEFINMEFADRR
ncbi:MAG: hypothetical protein AB7S77_23850 [Desulfatirhabdiaceae bacterium]